jgi:zinc and cadmium transporter
MYANTFWLVVLRGTLAYIITMLNTAAIRQYEKRGRVNTAYFLRFAAGLLISVAFIHIVPWFFTMNSSALVYLLAGLLMLYLFSLFLNALDQQYVYKRLRIDANVVFSVQNM